MAHRITNTAKGPRGIWSRGRLVWLEPGQTKTFEPDDPLAVMRHRDFEFEAGGEVPEPPADLAAKVKTPAKKLTADDDLNAELEAALDAKADPFDHDGDGKPGGTRKGAASTRKRGAAKRRTRTTKATK
jgi:hypothetical protein